MFRDQLLKMLDSVGVDTVLGFVAEYLDVEAQSESDNGIASETECDALESLAVQLRSVAERYGKITLAIEQRDFSKQAQAAGANADPQ